MKVGRFTKTEEEIVLRNWKRFQQVIHNIMYLYKVNYISY